MRTSRTLYLAEDNTDVAAVGTAFNSAKHNEVTLSGGPFLGRISGIVIQVKSLAGSGDPAGPVPSTLTMRLAYEADGDICIVTDTASSIYAGITTATTGTADYRADVDLSIDTGKVYVFCKTNQGTCTIDSVKITWEQ
tara:strand:- start:1639 stop:2052 length:414 start_codon:yes stop_codon:yes gene_type:complete